VSGFADLTKLEFKCHELSDERKLELLGRVRMRLADEVLRQYADLKLLTKCALEKF